MDYDIYMYATRQPAGQHSLPADRLGKRDMALSAVMMGKFNYQMI